jgi:hypothetical protein
MSKKKGTERKMEKEDTLMTFSQAAEKFPAFSVGSLRWMRQQNTNGFNRCVKSVGRRRLISLNIFLDWLDKQKG